MTAKYPRFNITLVFLFSLFLLSCSTSQLTQLTTIEKPVIEFQQYQIISVSDKQVKINIVFNVFNPNDIAIDSFFMNYELFVNEKSFIKGLKVNLKLIPKGKSVITVPIDVNYKTLVSSISSVANLIAKGKRNLPMFANIAIFGEFEVIKYVKHDFRYQKKISMNVPLPRYNTKDIMQFIQGVR